MDVILTCSCGSAIPVRFADAGKKVHCKCQQMVDVPRLRLLREMSGQESKPFVLEELTRKQRRGRRLLAIICFLMTFYLFTCILHTFQMTSWLVNRVNPRIDLDEHKMLTVMGMVSVVSFVSFVVFAFFACSGHLWARILLIIYLLRYLNHLAFCHCEYF